MRTHFLFSQTLSSLTVAVLRGKSYFRINDKNLTDFYASKILWIVILPLLEEIDLRDCNLTLIPVGLSHADVTKNLRLKLSGNPITGFQRAMIEGGSSASDIIVTLQRGLEGGEITCREIKLMVVGDAAVGMGRHFLNYFR